MEVQILQDGIADLTRWQYRSFIPILQDGSTDLARWYCRSYKTVLQILQEYSTDLIRSQYRSCKMALQILQDGSTDLSYRSCKMVVQIFHTDLARQQYRSCTCVLTRNRSLSHDSLRLAMCIVCSCPCKVCSRVSDALSQELCNLSLAFLADFTLSDSTAPIHFIVELFSLANYTLLFV